MTEVDTEEKSEESTSEPEQIEKEEKDEIVPAENSKTDVIDNAGDTQKVSDNPVDDDTDIQAGSLDTLEDESKSASKIILQEKTGEGDAAALAALSTVEVQFTEGCASEDGSEVRKDADITFLVLPKAGYKLKSLGWAADADASKFTKDTALTSITLAGEGPYTVTKDKLADGKSLLIVAETEEIVFTLNKSGVGTLNKVTTADGKTTLAAATDAETKFVNSKAGSIEINVSGLDKDKKYIAKAWVEGGEPLDLGEGTKKEADPASGTDKVPYRTYTFDATTLDEVEVKNADITVNVDISAVQATTVNAVPATVEPADTYTVSRVTIAADNAEQRKYVTYATTGTYEAGKQVAFMLTPDAAGKYEVDGDIEVKLTKANKDDIDLGKATAVADSTFLTAEEITAGKKVYSVTIPTDLPESDYALQINVKTKLQAAKSTKITFTSDKADFLTILGGASTMAPVKAGTEYRVEGAAYKTAISSREGYQITKAEVTVKGTNGNTASDTFTHTYILDGEKQEDGSISNYPRYMIDEQTIDLSGTNTPGVTSADSKAWKATEVTINIEVSAEVEGADEQKVVTFDNKSGVDPATDGIPYVLTVAEPDEENNKVSYNKETKKATIEENTPYLSFRVAAETEPVVVVDLDGDSENDETDTKLLEMTKGSGSYEYQIPAKAFIGNKGSVTITRKTAQVKADIPALNAQVEYAYKEGEVTKRGTLTNGVTATIDTDAEVKFTVRGFAGNTAPIKAVTWQYGEDGAAQTVAESGEGYVFTAKSSNEKAIVVKVDYETNERIYVKNGDYNNTFGEEDYYQWKAYEPGATVEVDYESEIRAYVSTGKDNTITLINALVYDGTKLAQTKAKVVANEAVIETIAESEQGKPLTITLVKADRTKVSFNIKPDKKASEVGYEELGENRNVTLGADMDLKLSVNTNDAKAGKLAAAVIADAEELPKTVGDTPATSNDNIITSYNGNTRKLTITAKSIKSDVEKAGVVVLYNKTDKTIVGGSAIRVKVEAPFMQKEDVTKYSPKGTVIGRNYTIAMDKAALQAVAEKQAQLVEEENAYYTVKVTHDAWTKPADMEDAAWTAAKTRIEDYLTRNLYMTENGRTVSIGQLLNDGGHTIRLIPEDVEPLELSFKVVVTPVQVLADDSAVTGTKWESGEVKTAKVNYSESLKLGKGESKLTTGRDEDIVVATPEFAEGGNNRYNWVVQPVFINNKTKKTLGDEYAGLSAKWNPAAGTVTVNAAAATAYGNKYGNNYKDLAIKITVFTETGDYGVSGIKKLTVQNGIEDMSLTVQPEILYKSSSKKVTVSTTVGYNDSAYYTETQNKYRVPQKKAAAYELSNVGKALAGKVSVDTKGKITLDKGITLSDKVADNRFMIRAVAADYEGNTVNSGWKTVTVIGATEALNDLTLFDISEGSNKAKPLTVANGSAFEVVNASNQYRVAVLTADAKANADGTYNLNNSGYVYNSGLITFTSSNKGIKVNQYGNITISKVGKTNITAALKSDKKVKKVLKNVNFVVENKPIVAILTQYANSDFTNAYKSLIYEQNGEFEAEGNTTGYYELSFYKLVKDENGKDKYESFTLPNYSLSFSKNAKKAAYQPYTSRVRFTATGTNATVTVSNKEKAYKNSNRIVITIKNAADANLQNAPKVSVITNSTNPILAGKGNDITVKVTPAKKTDKIWDAEKSTYVMLSIDQTKKTKASVNNIFSGELDLAKTLRRESDTEGRFDLWMNSYCQAENYTLIVTMGTMEDGVFTQTHKEARLNIKPKNANTKIKATAKYTLNPYGASSQEFNVSGGDFNNEGDVYFLNAPEHGNFAQNVIMKGGKPNEFNRFFEITAAYNHDTGYWDYDNNEWVPGYADGVKGSTIAIRQDLTPDELKLLADKDYMKNNLTGYVTVTNGYQELDVKITVALKAQKDLKLKAEATPTITGKVVTDIRVMNGKEPVSIEAYSISGNSLDFKSYYETVKDTGDQAQKDAEKAAELARLSQGIIRVSADDAKKGKQSFDLQIVTSDTAYGYKYAEKEVGNNKVYDTDKCLLTNALKVSGKIEVKEIKNAKNKVVFAKGATTWKVGRSDWATWANEDGSTWYGWGKGLAYSIKNKLSGVKKIDVAADKTWIWVGSNDYTNGEQWLDININKAELVSAMAKDKNLKWGKSVKVKATFSYLDKDDKALAIPKDTVTFTITLPEQPGFENTADLNTEITKNKAKLQNFADRRFREATEWELNNNWDLAYDNDGNYIWNDDNAKKKLFAEEWVKWELTDELKNISKGTTAALDVDAKYADNKCVYTIKVEGQKVIDFTSRFEANLDSVETALEAIRDNLISVNANTKANQAKALGLKYSPMTEAGDLRTKLIGILREQNLLTNNMSVSVVRVDKDNRGNVVTKAPSTTGNGYFKATVTVKDRNLREYRYWNGSQYVDNNKKEVTLDYTFDQLSALTDYQTGTKSIKDATNGLNSAKLTELINKAYFKNNGGIDADHVMNNDMENALIAEIEAFANTLVADNEYLSVSGINKPSFTVEYVDTNNDSTEDSWKVSFIISYTNADPAAKRAEDKEFDVSVEDVTAQFSTFNGGQTTAQLKAAAETAMGDKILPATCNTKDAAIAAIKKIITDEITNPAYKADAQLKIELNGVESEAFKAPVKEGETTTAGWINVKVTYDAAKETPSEKGEYTFTIGSTVTSSGETIEEKAERSATLVKALLTQSFINDAVVEAYKTNQSVEAVKTAVAGKIKTEAAKVLIGDVTLKTDNEVTMGDIVLPKSNKEDGSYAAIKVTLSYTNTAGEAATREVTIDAGVLTHGDDGLYQSIDEFRTALETAVTNTLVPYGAYTEEVDGVTKVKDDQKSTIKNDIATEVGRIAALPEIATNPKWGAATVTDVDVTTGQTPDTSNTQYTVDQNSKQITVTKVVMTIGEAPNNTKTVTVKIAGPNDRKVENVVIKSIGDVTVPTSGKDGSTVENAVEIEAPETDIAWDLVAEVTGTNLTDSDKDLTWILKKDESDAWNTVSDGNAADKIEIAGGKLTVAKDAWVAGESITGYLVATAYGDESEKENAKKETGVFVKIKLPEKYELAIKDSDGTSEARTTLEAPADETPVTYTYKAVLEGSHVKDTTVVEFEAPTVTPTDNKTTLVVQADKSKLLATVAKEAKDHEITLKAKVKDKEDAVTLPIKVVANETLVKNAPIKLQADGMTDAEWKDGVLTIKNQTAKAVKIPFIIEDSSRDWTKLAVGKFEVTVKTNEQGANDFASGITVVKGTGKERGKLFLQVVNTVPEVKPAAAAAGDTPAVAAPEFTLTATFDDATGKQAQVVTTLDFKLVVVKKLTDITIAHDTDATGETDYVDGTTVTKQDGNTVVTLKATVNGAHVSTAANADDQKVTWKIASKGARSKATISPDGKLTIPENSVDNVIRVTAISTADKTVTGSKTFTVVTTP